MGDKRVEKNRGFASRKVGPASDDERVAQRVMQRYAERLAACQAVDFDDLVGLPLKLLRTDADTRARWQQTLRYLLVNEVHDTNATQYELLGLLGDRSFKSTFSRRWGRDGAASIIGRGSDRGLCG